MKVEQGMQKKAQQMNAECREMHKMNKWHRMY